MEAKFGDDPLLNLNENSTSIVMLLSKSYKIQIIVASQGSAMLC